MEFIMTSMLKKSAKILTVSSIFLSALSLTNSYAAEKLPKFKPPHDAIQYTAAPASYSDAISRASSAVVSIHSSKLVSREMHPLMRDPFFRQFFGDPRNGQQQPPQEMQSGIGSGVIVTTDGYILTNNHVISDADEIEVKLSDGRSANAEVIGRDLETDLAILKINLKKLPSVALGSAETTKVGDVVFAIGNPFNVGVTVTQGIVSATHRSHLGINTFENFIQTDAAINPGNSGGALIDANGNLIGINNAIYSRTGGYQGIGFAIPVDMAKDIMGQLINKGHVTRGWLGITVHKLTDELRKSLDYPKGEGTVIASVIRGGPAAKAGLRSGDIIININNSDVSGPSDVLKITANLKPEKAYPIAVIRQGETHDLRVEIGKRPTQSDSEKKTKDKDDKRNN